MKGEKMEYTKVASNAFQLMQMNAGIVLKDFDPSDGSYQEEDIIGATTGGITFNSNPEYTDFGEDVDNVPANTKQLKRITSYDPVISGTLLTVNAALVAKLVGGADVDSTKITPRDTLTDADFDDIWFVGDYSDQNKGSGSAGFVAIHIMNAMNTTGFQLQTAKNGKGQCAFEFHGHYDLEDVETVPFEIYVKAGTPVLGTLTVTSEAGTSSGKSKITVSGYTLGSGESFVYKAASGTAPSVAYGDDVSTWTALTSGSEYALTNGNKITVVAKDSNSKACGAAGNTIIVSAT